MATGRSEISPPQVTRIWQMGHCPRLADRLHHVAWRHTGTADFHPLSHHARSALDATSRAQFMARGAAGYVTWWAEDNELFLRLAVARIPPAAGERFAKVDAFLNGPRS